MRRSVGANDDRTTCAACQVDTPAGSQEALRLAWVSTMAFVAMGIIEKGDADNGVTYCPVCAERFIGPAWHSIGTWSARKHRARIQWECMMTGVPDAGTVH